MKNLNKAKTKIIEIGKRLYQNNFVAANNGNISYRVDESRIIITPSGVSKGFMKKNELVITDMDGNVVAGSAKPSSEIQTHLTIYQNRNNVKSVCHAHPIFATAFTCTEKSINTALLSDVIIGLGKIAEVKYAPPGSSQLSENLLPLLEDHDAFLLANHGVITVGNSITSAFYKMETVEHYAQIHFSAMQLAPMKVLNRKQIKSLLELRKKFGVRKNLNKFEKNHKS